MVGGTIIELADRDEALAMDAVLVRMARSQTVVRLSIGEGFVALAKGWQELGFSSFEGYVRERCARSGRWGQDTRALAQRLSVLPWIRRRLLSGAMVWSMAEALARVATADDEEELLEATRGMTVRQVKRVLRERGGAQAQADDEVRFGTLELSVDFAEAWALEATRPMIEVLDGRGEPGAWLESLLAEGQCALSNVAPDADLVPEDVAQRQAAWLASIVEGKRSMDRREARAEASLPALPEVTLDAEIEPMPCGAAAIDGRLLRELAPQLASRDLRFGELLARFFGLRAWRVLGFASERQYAEERLGISRSSVHARITLHRRVLHLEKLGEALRESAIGYEAAALIARVATPDTEAQWIERAQRRTYKHLREEVDAVELIARMMRVEEAPGPPTDEELRIVQALERDMKSGAYARRAFGIEREDDAPSGLDGLGEGPYAEMAQTAIAVQEALRTVIVHAREGSASMTAEEAEAACTGVLATEGDEVMIDLEDDVVWSKAVPMSGHEQCAENPIQMFAGSAAAMEAGDETEAVQMFGAGSSSPSSRRKLRVRVRAREDTILHFRMLQAAYERSGLGGSFARPSARPGSFVQFLVLAFWSSWAEVLGRTNMCEGILRRDNYICTCPVCGRSSAPGPHHVHPRARGGGDEPWNLTSPCERCHLDGVHGGRIRVRGKAPDLVWHIGRTPIMEVRGRERRLLT